MNIELHEITIRDIAENMSIIMKRELLGTMGN